MSNNFNQTIALLGMSSVILLVNQSIQLSWVWRSLNLIILACGIYTIYPLLQSIQHKTFQTNADFLGLGFASILLGLTNLFPELTYKQELNSIGLALIAGIACYELIIAYTNFKVTKPTKNEIKSLNVIENKPKHSILRGEALNA